MLLDDDTEVHPDCIEKLLDAMKRDVSIGIIGTCPVTSRVEPFERGGSMMADLLGGHTLAYQNDAPLLYSTVAVQSHGILLRRSMIENIGLLDERFINYCADGDYCLRAKMAGYKVCYLNQAMLIHKAHQTVTRVKCTLLYDQMYFVYKWFGGQLNGLLQKIPLDKELGITGKMDLIIEGKTENMEKFKRRFGMYS